MPEKLFVRLRQIAAIRGGGSYEHPALVERYDELVGSRRRILEAKYVSHQALACLNLQDGQPVAMLDIAAGTGLSTAGMMLAAQTHNLMPTITAIDASQPMLAQALLKIPGLVTHIQDMNQTPWTNIADASINFATCLWALRFIEDREQFCEEIHRILAPGGIVALPNPYRDRHRIARRAAAVVRRGSRAPHWNDALNRVGLRALFIEHEDVGAIMSHYGIDRSMAIAPIIVGQKSEW